MIPLKKILTQSRAYSLYSGLLFFPKREITKSGASSKIRKKMLPTDRTIFVIVGIILSPKRLQAFCKEILFWYKNQKTVIYQNLDFTTCKIELTISLEIFSLFFNSSKAGMYFLSKSSNIFERTEYLMFKDSAKREKSSWVTF